MSGKVKLVHKGAEPVKYKGKTIGEVFPDGWSDGWGYLCYVSDNGADMITEKEAAIEDCIKDHIEHVGHLKQVIKEAQKDLAKWGVR